jgi:hypothetical protein
MMDQQRRRRGIVGWGWRSNTVDRRRGHGKEVVERENNVVVADEWVAD